ncbi:DUF934 domain-containing protein [Pararobbsia silviterrae]|uniref:DUF934 domain-containing protein n=2 Tax=Pararobbsia silviterrae TaxID=1792498 RepID=A0A494XAG8_9BURK|nr:DUF934 domain-containing protein [Pararobbsia silviterrae]
MIRLDDGRPTIVENRWTLVRDAAQATERIAQGRPALERAILPVDIYLGALDAHADLMLETGAWIPPEADVESWATRLAGAPVIAVDFPSFRDGRGLSIGVMVRTRYGFKGELLAIGDVLRDQLEYMRRCGFDAFWVRADKRVEDAIKGFSELSVRYQGIVGDPTPSFRRRGDTIASGD